MSTFAAITEQKSSQVSIVDILMNNVRLEASGGGEAVGFMRKITEEGSGWVGVGGL